MQKIYFFIALAFFELSFSLQAQQFSTSHTSISPFCASSGDTKIPFKTSGSGLRSGSSAVFEVKYVGSWTAAERQAFEYALKLWEDRMTGVQGIKITVAFGSVNGLVQTNFGVVRDFRSWKDFPKEKVWWPTTLLKKLESNWNPKYGAYLKDYDISITFNSNKNNWYFGTDANPPSNKYDFVTVALGEITAGLGFKSSIRMQNNTPTYLNMGMPYLFDLQIEGLVAYKNALKEEFSMPPLSAAFRNFVTYGSMTFVKPGHRDRYKVSNPALHAPATFEADVTGNYFRTGVKGEDVTRTGALKFSPSSALMAPYVQKGSAVHYIGQCVLGVLETMGWTFIDPQGPPMDPVIYYREEQSTFAYWADHACLEIYADGAETISVTHWEEGLGGVSVTNYNYSAIPLNESLIIDSWMKNNFQIKAINKYGVSREIHIVNKTYTPPPYVLYPSPQYSVTSTSSEMILNFKDKDGQSVDPSVKSVRILNVTSPALMRLEGIYTPGTPIDVSSLPSGVYSVRATDREGNVYEEKVMK